MYCVLNHSLFSIPSRTVCAQLFLTSFSALLALACICVPVSGLVPLGVIPTLWPGWSLNTHIWPCDMKPISAPYLHQLNTIQTLQPVCCMFNICPCLPFWPYCCTCLSFPAVAHYMQFWFPCLCMCCSLYLELSFPLFCLQTPIHTKHSVRLKIYTVLFLSYLTSSC